MEDIFMIVALDGGAASGKSSTAGILAHKHGLLHIDTGLHYRALTQHCIDHKITPEAWDTPVGQDATTKSLDTIRFSTLIKGNYAHIVIHEKHFEGPELKTPEINAHVSQYAAVPRLREVLCVYQRSLVHLAREKGFKGIVMEGRDIGSIVLPEAKYKFFLHADLRLREQRRAAEGIRDNISARDAVDSQRQVAPLLCPKDAIRIDTSLKDLDAVVDAISSYLPSA